MRYRGLGAFPSVAVFAFFVVLMFCHEHGLNVHAHIGEVIEDADNRVAKLDGDSLRLASAGFLVLVARALELADSARDTTAFSWTSFANSFTVIFVSSVSVL